jgi:hypothetical protein
VFIEIKLTIYRMGRRSVPGPNGECLIGQRNIKILYGWSSNGFCVMSPIACLSRFKQTNFIIVCWQSGIALPIPEGKMACTVSALISVIRAEIFEYKHVLLHQYAFFSEFSPICFRNRVEKGLIFKLGVWCWCPHGWARCAPTCMLI